MTDDAPPLYLVAVWRCTRCGRSWCGGLVDAPPCPACGARAWEIWSWDLSVTGALCLVPASSVML
jgi:hypothetical protein